VKPSRKKISRALKLIFRGIAALRSAFGRAFTIDGRLVGDIGETIAAIEYDLVLDEKQQAVHDATARGRRRVQIKATFKNHLTFGSVPDYYLGLKLYPDGHFEEVYNGPGKHIARRYSHRKGVGQDLLSFPVAELKALSDEVESSHRIAARRRGRRA
jgi:hypothetical protein